MLLQNSDAKVRNLSMQTNTFPQLFLRNLRINISLIYASARVDLPKNPLTLHAWSGNTAIL